MADLRAICGRVELVSPTLCLYNGNMVFESSASRDEVRAKLAADLDGSARAPVSIVRRRPTGLEAILTSDPFPETPGNPMLVWIFREEPKQTLKIKDQTTERIHRAMRDRCVHFSDGAGRAKLPLSATQTRLRATAARSRSS